PRAPHSFPTRRSSDLKADVDAVKRGAANVRRHIRNVKQFGVPVVVALNRFLTDSDAELDAVRVECAAEGVGVELCEVWEKGGEGDRKSTRLNSSHVSI